MKFLNIILLIICTSTLVFTSCSKEDVATPDASFTINDKTDATVPVKVGSAVQFKGTGSGAFFTVWTGDKKHNYANRNANLQDVSNEKVTIVVASGAVVDMKSKIKAYTYNEAGTYTVVWVATNTGNDGVDVKTSIVTKTVTVE